MPQISGKIFTNANFSVLNWTEIFLLMYWQCLVWHSCRLIWMAFNLTSLIWLNVCLAYTLFCWRNGLGPSCTRLYTHLYIWLAVSSALHSWLTPSTISFYTVKHNYIKSLDPKGFFPSFKSLDLTAVQSFPKISTYTSKIRKIKTFIKENRAAKN